MPFAPSFDTVGWFARSPGVLDKVARVLFADGNLDSGRPQSLLLAEDCFALLGEPERQFLLHAAAALVNGLKFPSRPLP